MFPPGSAVFPVPSLVVSSSCLRSRCLFLPWEAEQHCRWPVWFIFNSQVQAVALMRVGLLPSADSQACGVAVGRGVSLIAFWKKQAFALNVWHSHKATYCLGFLHCMSECLKLSPSLQIWSLEHCVRVLPSDFLFEFSLLSATSSSTNVNNHWFVFCHRLLLFPGCCM